MSDSTSSTSCESQGFKFKKPSRKPLRQRREISEEEDAGVGDEEDVL